MREHAAEPGAQRTASQPQHKVQAAPTHAPLATGRALDALQLQRLAGNRAVAAIVDRDRAGDPAAGGGQGVAPQRDPLQPARCRRQGGADQYGGAVSYDMSRNGDAGVTITIKIQFLNQSRNGVDPAPPGAPPGTPGLGALIGEPAEIPAADPDNRRAWCQNIVKEQVKPWNGKLTFVGEEVNIIDANTKKRRAKRAAVKARMAVAARSGVVDAAVRAALEQNLTAASEPGLAPSVPHAVTFETTANFSNLTVWRGRRGRVQRGRDHRSDRGRVRRLTGCRRTGHGRRRRRRRHLDQRAGVRPGHDGRRWGPAGERRRRGSEHRRLGRRSRHLPGVPGDLSSLGADREAASTAGHLGDGRIGGRSGGHACCVRRQDGGPGEERLGRSRSPAADRCRRGPQGEGSPQLYPKAYGIISSIAKEDVPTVSTGLHRWRRPAGADHRSQRSRVDHPGRGGQGDDDTRQWCGGARSAESADGGVGGPHEGPAGRRQGGHGGWGSFAAGHRQGGTRPERHLHRAESDGGSKNTSIRADQFSPMVKQFNSKLKNMWEKTFTAEVK